eukprot:TRINITY_DN28274_c0_g1_i1.p1 TRINITY_DN28274_c0_g1~~TRINITY_DN28274_c0_g1_i1.p1  ORF type:complete len:156 (+),score=24.13 TRINITY_DN28274_c0_g1_i1:55-522(+)
MMMYFNQPFPKVVSARSPWEPSLGFWESLQRRVRLASEFHKTFGVSPAMIRRFIDTACSTEDPVMPSSSDPWAHGFNPGKDRLPISHYQELTRNKKGKSSRASLPKAPIHPKPTLSKTSQSDTKAIASILNELSELKSRHTFLKERLAALEFASA